MDLDWRSRNCTSVVVLNMLEEARVFDPPKLTSFACVGP